MRIGGAARRAAAQHEPGVDVPDPARDGGRARPGARRACSPSPATRCSSSTRPGRRVVNEKLPYNELAQTFFQWDPLRRRVPVPRARPGLGPAQPGALGERRVRAADRRRHRRERRARAPRRDARGARRTAIARAASSAYAYVTGGLPPARRLRGQPAGAVDRRFNELAGDRRRRGLRPRRARRAAALQRRREGRAGPHEPDDVAARGRRARTTPRSSPAARWTPRAARRRRPTARSSTTWTGRSPASTASATASPRRRPAPTGPAAATLGPIIAFAYRAAERAADTVRAQSARRSIAWQSPRRR